MHDAVGVGMVERVSDGCEEALLHFVGSHRSARGDVLAQRFSVDVFHDEVAAVVASRILYDVGGLHLDQIAVS